MLKNDQNAGGRAAQTRKCDSGGLEENLLKKMSDSSQKQRAGLMEDGVSTKASHILENQLLQVLRPPWCMHAHTMSIKEIVLSKQTKY